MNLAYWHFCKASKVLCSSWSQIRLSLSGLSRKVYIVSAQSTNFQILPAVDKLVKPFLQGVEHSNGKINFWTSWHFLGGQNMVSGVKKVHGIPSLNDIWLIFKTVTSKWENIACFQTSYVKLQCSTVLVCILAKPNGKVSSSWAKAKNLKDYSPMGQLLFLYLGSWIISISIL